MTAPPTTHGLSSAEVGSEPSSSDTKAQARPPKAGTLEREKGSGWVT
jgi:hypothetical protein